MQLAGSFIIWEEVKNAANKKKFYCAHCSDLPCAAAAKEEGITLRGGGGGRERQAAAAARGKKINRKTRAAAAAASGPTPPIQEPRRQERGGGGGLILGLSKVVYNGHPPNFATAKVSRTAAVESRFIHPSGGNISAL